MKNLKFLIIAVALLISSTAFAASNLWEYYNGDLPSISERAEIYDIDDEYRGTAEQNIYLLGQLQGESGITLGGFRPSGYSGKLLTRLNEGGSETTFNTTPGTAPDGSSLTTAKIGDFVVLTINPGGANEEKISASAVSVSGTTATWTIINRGLSFTENAAVTDNKNQHAIGETVIISNDDHYFKAQYAAIDEDVTITGDWKVPTPANATSVVNRNYVDGAAFGGIGLSSETATGTVEIATGLEIASSTQNGTLGRLVIPASLATSTYNSATAGLKVVVTQNNGKIDSNFVATSSLYANSNLTGTTTMATSTSLFASGIKLIEIGKNIQVFSSTGTTTFSTPSGVSKIYVQLVSGGGGGAGCASGVNNNCGGGGGGGGGYVEEIVNITGTSTIQVFVGSGGAGGSSGANNGSSGTWSTFGTNGYYISATGGSGGEAGSDTGGNGGTGGVGSNGDINVIGGGGGAGIGLPNIGGSGYSLNAGGTGGNSYFGGGARGLMNSATGEAGLSYGGGGGGGSGFNSVSRAGGAGYQGIVIIRW